MAVQAQYPSKAFSPDLRSRIQIDPLDELQMMQGRDPHQHHQLVGSVNNFHGVSPFIFNINNDPVFSAPQSELTCIASGSKKRPREEPTVLMTQQTPMGFTTYPNLVQSRLIDSGGTSTSGRSSCSSPSPLAQDLAAHLYHQSLEIDALISLQNERLRFGLEQAQKRHCRALVSALEEQVLRKLREKDAELETASRRNAELEEKVRQMSSENLIWFNVAKNNEAIVSSLRSSLEQVLIQNSVNNAVQAKEGYGDSDGLPFPAEDAHSCCFEGENDRTNGAVRAASAAARVRRKKCRVCGDNDVSVLVLPCRHLCLCKDCESGIDTCPVCHVAKDACLQIFIS